MSKLEVSWAAVDRVQVQLLAVQGELAAEVESRRLFRSDGHKSAHAWLVATRSWSGAHARQVLRVGRMMDAMPVVAQAMHAARIGVDQVVALADVYANPRCGRRLAGYGARMVRHAQRMPFDRFVVLLRRWERLADAAGAFKDLDRVREGRGVRMASACGAFEMQACGGALAGEQMRLILEHFADVEFRADWAALVAEVGEGNATVSGLARTRMQRRFDAMHKIFLQAAATEPGAVLPDVMVNVVVDHGTLARGLVALFGGEVQPDDPSRFESARCETVDGVEVDPRDAALAALLGQVRRVLWTAPGIPTDVSVSRRLFTGAVRTAVEMLSPTCVRPGCSTPTSRCQIDHLQPASRGGPTAGWNGGPKCGPQNRFDYRHGYHTWRDPDGYWHVARPDGTEIGPTDWWDSS